jgi:hypothetical protein
MLRDCRKNRGAFSAVGHSVRSILHIATREKFPIRKKDGCADPESGVGRMRVLHDFLRRLHKSRLHATRESFLEHKRKRFCACAKSKAIVNPDQAVQGFFFPR